jgi:hypothetical protein
MVNEGRSRRPQYLAVKCICPFVPHASSLNNNISSPLATALMQRNPVRVAP